MNHTSAPPSFDFAISYAGSDRALAEQLASFLSDRGANVYIDTLYRAHLVGKRLDREFEWVFGPGTRFFVAIVSQSYVDRPWPQHEWSIAIREAERRSGEFILPLRLDDSLLVGLPSTVGHIDLREDSVATAADLLLGKLKGVQRPEVTQWVATFGILVEDVLSWDDLPRAAPTEYAHLCDWLAQDLGTRMKQSSLKNPRFMEDLRTGESLSVRITFDWDPREGPLQFGPLDWWDLLEVIPYEEAHPV